MKTEFVILRASGEDASKGSRSTRFWLSFSDRVCSRSSYLESIAGSPSSPETATPFPQRGGCCEKGVPSSGEKIVLTALRSPRTLAALRSP